MDITLEEMLLRFKFFSIETEKPDEFMLVMGKIRDVWNDCLTTEQRKSFEKMTDEELKRIYSKISIDFSDFSNVEPLPILEG